MEVLGPERFYNQLESLFAVLENQVRAGHIQFYGFATWHGLLSDPNEKSYIALEEVITRLKTRVGEDHHFKFIQLPFNKNRPEAQKKKNQRVNQQWVSVFDAAKELGLTVMTSAPFDLGNRLEAGDNPSETLKSILSISDIQAVMVGMRHVETVRKNLRLITILDH